MSQDISSEDNESQGHRKDQAGTFCVRPCGSMICTCTNREQQVSVVAHENLMLAIFLFHHQWRCTFDWEVTVVCEYTVHLLAGQKRLEDKYKDQDVLPKVNKTYMTGMIEAIKEYLRSPHSVLRVPFAYIIRKTITAQICGDYPKYATPVTPTPRKE